MNLYETLQSDLIVALKNKDTQVVSTLRLIINDIKNIAINNGGDRTKVEDDEVIKSLTKSAKQRKESIELFTQNNRPDLASGEKAELDIIEKYLPKMMTEDEIIKIVEPIIKNSSPKNFGLIMKDCMAILKGKADSSQVKSIIEKLIN